MCRISSAREIPGYWRALSAPPPEQLLQPRPSLSESSWLSKAPHASAGARDASKLLCLPCTPDKPIPSRCSPRSTSFLLLTTRSAARARIRLPGVNDGLPPRGLPPALCFLFPVGQLLPDRLQVLIGFLQAVTDLVDGSKDGNVIVCYALFGRMFAEELLNDENLFEQGLLWRIIRHEFDLSYEVVPRDVAHDRNDMPAFLPVQKIEITHGERDKRQRTENEKADCLHMALFIASPYSFAKRSFMKTEQLTKVTPSPCNLSKTTI